MATCSRLSYTMLKSVKKYNNFGSRIAHKELKRGKNYFTPAGQKIKQSPGKKKNSRNQINQFHDFFKNIFHEN